MSHYPKKQLISESMVIFIIYILIDLSFVVIGQISNQLNDNWSSNFLGGDLLLLNDVLVGLVAAGLTGTIGFVYNQIRKTNKHHLLSYIVPGCLFVIIDLILNLIIYQ